MGHEGPLMKSKGVAFPTGLRSLAFGDFLELSLQGVGLPTCAPAQEEAAIIGAPGSSVTCPTCFTEHREHSVAFGHLERSDQSS